MNFVSISLSDFDSTYLLIEADDLHALLVELNHVLILESLGALTLIIILQNGNQELFHARL